MAPSTPRLHVGSSRSIPLALVRLVPSTVLETAPTHSPALLRTPSPAHYTPSIPHSGGRFHIEDIPFLYSSPAVTKSPLTLSCTRRFPDHDVHLHRPLAAREVDFRYRREAELGVDERVDDVAAFEVAGAIGEVGLFLGVVSDGGRGLRVR